MRSWEGIKSISTYPMLAESSIILNPANTTQLIQSDLVSWSLKSYCCYLSSCLNTLCISRPSVVSTVHTKPSRTHTYACDGVWNLLYQPNFITGNGAKLIVLNARTALGNPQHSLLICHYFSSLSHCICLLRHAPLSGFRKCGNIYCFLVCFQHIFSLLVFQQACWPACSPKEFIGLCFGYISPPSWGKFPSLWQSQFAAGLECVEEGTYVVQERHG